MPAQRTRDIRTLEVTTDAQDPSFKIVSPMPRAFVFPVTNNLDSPYSSRSNSPEPFSFPSQQDQQCTLTTSSSSSSSSFTPPPPTCQTLRANVLISPLEAISLQHRKGSCSSENPERRPKKGEEDYVKRPENAFILFRRACCEERQAAQDEAAATTKGPAKKQRQADLSKTISQQWKSLSSEERAKWEEMAKKKKLEHEKMYPGYVYRPQRSKDKDGKTKNNKKVKKLEYDESNSLSYIIPDPRRQHHPRSNSEPSPPPYQAIQIPNVYMPASPTSPSLLPMISRRSAYTGPVQDVLSSFDYVPPSQPYVPPPYAMSGQFEQALQSSEFLRSIFAPTPDMQQDTTSPLQQIRIPEHTDSGLQVSPSSSVGSSSGPSSPSSGPYTPDSGLLYAQLSSDSSLEAQAQAEMQLQLEMQQQQEYAQATWDVWGDAPSMFQGDDFDLSKIQSPINTFDGLSKFTESIAIPEHELVYGQDYGHLSDGMLYHHDGSQSLGSYLGFDEMMAGQGF